MNRIYKKAIRVKKSDNQTVCKSLIIASVGSSEYLRFCDLGGARTLGPLIKSQLLYQLSYEVIILVAFRQNGFAGANMQLYF